MGGIIYYIHPASVLDPAAAAQDSNDVSLFLILIRVQKLSKTPNFRNSECSTFDRPFHGPHGP